MKLPEDELRKMFSAEVRAAIHRFHQALVLEEDQMPSGIIENKRLKVELAAYCAQIIEQAATNRLPFEAVTHLLRGFPFYQFGDSLDEAFALLHELDLAPELLAEDTSEQQIRLLIQLLRDYQIRMD